MRGATVDSRGLIRFVAMAAVFVAAQPWIAGPRTTEPTVLRLREGDRSVEIGPDSIKMVDGDFSMELTARFLRFVDSSAQAREVVLGSKALDLIWRPTAGRESSVSIDPAGMTIGERSGPGSKSCVWTSESLTFEAGRAENLGAANMLRIESIPEPRIVLRQGDGTRREIK